MSSSKNVLSVQKHSDKGKKRDFKAFLRDISDTVRNSDGQFKPYKNVAVFMTKWSNDDTGVAPVEAELKDIFEKIYNFTVVQYVFDPTGRTDREYHRAAIQAIVKFIFDHDKPDCLTIYVYSGHGTFRQGENQYWIHGQANGYTNGSGKLDWSSLMAPYISLPYGDVLFIFDSCYAGALAKGNGPELLAASDSQFIAASDLDVSFTKALCKCLKTVNGTPNSIANFYSMIIRYDRDMTHVPTHICKPNQASIVLHKVEAVNAPLVSQKKIKLNNRPWIDQPHVLILVRVRDGLQQKDVISFTKWLVTNMPDGVSPADIKVHGWFTSDSGVALVALPIELWTMLPVNDEAYDFVSFVSSDNLLASQTLPLGQVKPTGENL